MSNFRDALGRDWTIELDALSLGRLRDQHKIDLLDINAGSYILLESDEEKLTLTLLVLCAEQVDALKLTPQQFSRGLTGEAITRAYQAVVAGAAAFFPPKKWSVMLSRCKQQRQIDESWAGIRPMLRLLKDPDVPERMVESVLLAVTEHIGRLGSIDSQSLAASTSARTPAETQSSAATDSPASVASAPSD